MAVKTREVRDSAVAGSVDPGLLATHVTIESRCSASANHRLVKLYFRGQSGKYFDNVILLTR